MHGFCALKSIFLSDLNQNLWIKLDVFCRIFLNLKRIHIENVNVSTSKDEEQQKPQETVILSPAFLEDLLFFLKTHCDAIKVEEIVIANPNQSKLNMFDALELYKERFIEDINWTICIEAHQDKNAKLIFKCNVE